MAEMEKITINLTPVDLGRIDMLVEEGFYQNRSDLIRAAVRRQLDEHAAALEAKAARHQDWQAGVLRFERTELEAMARENVKRDLHGVGALVFGSDVAPSLVDWVFGRIRWYGTVDGPAPVKAVVTSKSGQG